jgi:hypothetical protein
MAIDITHTALLIMGLFVIYEVRLYWLFNKLIELEMSIKNR